MKLNTRHGSAMPTGLLGAVAVELSKVTAERDALSARLAEAERLLFQAHDELDYHYGMELRAAIRNLLGAGVNKWDQIERATDSADAISSVRTWDHALTREEVQAEFDGTDPTVGQKS